MNIQSDVDLVRSAVGRLQQACRARHGPRREGMTPQQARILAQLDARDPMMVTELAEYLGVTPSTMSLSLKRLRDAGWVVSERDPEDRRVMNVRLTAVGERLRAEAGELDPERVDALLRRLSPSARREALHGLRLLAVGADAFMTSAAGAMLQPSGGESRL